MIQRTNLIQTGHQSTHSKVVLHLQVTMPATIFRLVCFRLYLDLIAQRGFSLPALAARRRKLSVRQSWRRGGNLQA